MDFNGSNITNEYEYYVGYPMPVYLQVPDNYEIALYCTFFILIVVGNVWVIVAIIRQPKLRKSATNMFIVSLSLSDILVAVFQIPYLMFFQLIPDVFVALNDNIFVCRTFAWMQWTARCVTINSLIGVAIDRFRAIVQPLKPKVTRTQATVIITCIWVISLGYSLRKPILLHMYEYTFNNVTQKWCMVPFEYHDIANKFHLVDFFVMFLLPLVLLCIMYVIMIKSLWSKKGPSNASNRGKQKAIKMLTVVVISFALTWLPYYMYSLYYEYTEYADIPWSILRGIQVQHHFATLAYISNSWTNPILYAYFNENFRNELYRMLPCLANCCKRNKVSPESRTRPVTLQKKREKRELINVLSNAAFE
ncbi:neuropeptide FF receptor 2-like [Saccoglossus kowalevskii]|uniref:Neuropeptide FF receptor 2-like n=1 Tax=Saccoglossus kowalevskii TaxID=10224 RepID=A0ABM0GZ59_SACKO|nr:PREDICTED: neuropeptide FF receptor 2-like [Saccoglossus kowalevskii]